MTIMLILINAIAVTISTVLGGVATRRLALPFVLFIAGVSAAAISLGFALATSGASSATGLYLGFTAGLAGGAGLSLAYRAYAIGPVGVPASTIACTTAAILAIVGFLSGESLTPFRMIGLALCGIAILLVAQRPAAGRRDHRASTLVFALLAAVGFSCFVLLIDRAPQGDGLWPLVSARAGVLVVASVMLVIVLGPGKTRPAAPTVRSIASWLAVLAGILDATSNLFLLLALQSADLILVAILAPVVPVLTAVVGKIFLHEVLTRPQVFGLAVGAGAVVFAAL